MKITYQCGCCGAERPECYGQYDNDLEACLHCHFETRCMQLTTALDQKVSDE